MRVRASFRRMGFQRVTSAGYSPPYRNFLTNFARSLTRFLQGDKLQSGLFASGRKGQDPKTEPIRAASMKSRNLRKRRARFETLEGRLTLSGMPWPCPATVVAPTVAAAVHEASAVIAKPVTNSAAKFFGTTEPIQNTSSNWSGYAINSTAGSVSYVAGTWTVPTVSTSTNGYSAVWVGIDGYSSQSVEQLGTGEDVSGGRASYYAWYEMYPSDSVTINSMTVKPGDSMTASVTYNATNKDFVLSITDTTESTAKSPDKFSITLGGSGLQRFGRMDRRGAFVRLWHLAAGQLRLGEVHERFRNHRRNDRPDRRLAVVTPSTFLPAAGCRIRPRR